MLGAYRRMRVSTKLLISSLAFALPLAVLGYFMDISFVYDLDIARSEMLGNAYLRELAPLAKHVPLYRMAAVHGTLPQEPSPEQEAAAVDQALAALAAVDPATLEALQLTPRDLAAMGLQWSDPVQLAELWSALRRDPADEALYDEFMDRVRALWDHVAESSLLVADPALDSNYLALVVTKDLPQFNDWMTGLLDFAMAMDHGRGAGGPAGGGDMGDMELARLDDFVVLLDDVLENRIRHDSEMALAEDPDFYRISPTLQGGYRQALDAFADKARALVDSLGNRARGRRTGWQDQAFFSTWRETHQLGCDLFDVGSRELDVLLSLRMASYTSWRRWGFALSAAALLLAALMVLSVSRDVNRLIGSMVAYTRRVGRGDYDARPGGFFSRDMGELSDNVQLMVGQLKNRLAFSQGIQESIAAPFLVADMGGSITFVNAAMVKLLEHDALPETYLGSDVAAFFNHDHDMLDLTADCLVKRICVENREIPLTGGKGGDHVVSVYVSPLYDLNDELMGFSTFIFDLTLLKEHEQEILEKRDEIQRLAAIPMENPSPVLTVEKDGAISYTNLATELTISRFDLRMDEFLPSNHAEIVAACLTTESGRNQVEHRVKGRVYAWTYNPLHSHQVVHIHVQDVTDQKRMEEQLLHDAFHDALTGLPNRALFMDRVERALARAKEVEDAAFAVLFLDMDRFKVVNDSLGHAAGDELLMALSRRMQNALESHDTLARLGGDEFTVLLTAVNDVSESLALAQRLQEIIAEPFKVHGHELYTTASIGIVFDRGAYAGPEELLRDADTAMYRAKATGKAKCEVFDAEMHRLARQRLTMEMDLKRAVDNREFKVFYQPMLDLRMGTIAGFEALVRWFHPEHGMISPAQFIPLAEETGLVVPMGMQVLKQALAWGSRRLQEPGVPQDLMVSVNLSVRQMTSAALVDDLEAALAATGFPAENLKLEVTESGIMDNAASALALMETLRERRIKLSIDDFGTGYSSLSYLHRFPFDFLKVDQSFVRLMETEDEELGIVNTIISLAHDMSKQVIAEGIETPSQHSRLKEMGCEFGQGFLFAKPLPEDEASKLLSTDPRW